MAKETGMYLDFSKFDKEFTKLVRNAIPNDAEDGLFKAMNEVLRDSIELPPQAPKDMGDLWGSTAGTVEVIKGKGDKILGVSGGFNIKYAHRHHEAEPGEFTYTTGKGASQPGPKFMQSKLAMYGKKYYQIVANVIKRGGK